MNTGKPWLVLAYAAVCCAIPGQVARSQESDANVQDVLERVLAGRERIVSGHARYRVGGVWQAGGEPMYSLVEGWMDGDPMRLDYWQRVDPETGKTLADGWLDPYVVGPSACATFVNGALMPDGKRGRGALTVSDTRIGFIPIRMSASFAHLGLSNLAYSRSVSVVSPPAIDWGQASKASSRHVDPLVTGASTAFVEPGTAYSRERGVSALVLPRVAVTRKRRIAVGALRLAGALSVASRRVREHERRPS
jgi:hypothetical protein